MKLKSKSTENEGAPGRQMKRNGATEEQEASFRRFCVKAALTAVLVFGLTLLTAVLLNLCISPLVRTDTDPVLLALLVCTIPTAAVFAVGMLVTCVLVALEYGPIRGRKKKTRRMTK
jgi:hypothetical protein